MFVFRWMLVNLDIFFGSGVDNVYVLLIWYV